MTRLAEVGLLTGWLPWTLVALAVIAGLWLLIVRDRRFLLRVLPIALVVTILLIAAGYVLIEYILRPFPDHTSVWIYVLVGVGILTLLLAIMRIVRSKHRLRTIPVALITVLVVVLAVANSINGLFAFYPTVGTAVGIKDYREIDLADVPGAQASPVTGSPLSSVWQAPSGMPSDGVITTATIPGTASNFTTRPAEIYLPPAYFADPRPLLPVLVLLAGQPGAPIDWVVGGKLAETANAWAAEHNGLAPVVVVADGTGSAVANPLCVDSPKGNAATFLTVDVPTWIKQNLQVSSDPKQWAIGGLSYGGTCALQLATTHPELFPSFLDFSGQLQPTAGHADTTLQDYFNGDAAAFAAINPLDIMAAHQFPNTAGRFVVGADDRAYRDDLYKVFQAAQAAGMNVTFDEVPGSHSYQVWSVALRESMDWLGTRLGMTP